MAKTVKKVKPESKLETKVKIENIVSSITLGQDINIKKFATSVKGVENPQRFPGLIFRIAEPRVSMLIFRTGKVICSGARSRSDIDKAVEILLAKLKEGKIKILAKPKIEIQNIVASSSVGFKINLDQLALSCENTEYEPEQFPGLVFRLDEPHTVMLLFRSGRMIITGAKTHADAKAAAEKTKEIVEGIEDAAI
jgi:transcription initiation factor TFIID TATA-box-binding protein